MVEDLSEGDVAETIAKFYQQSRAVVPPKKSTLGLHKVQNTQISSKPFILRWTTTWKSCLA